jgi:uncharacterized phage-associated protein
MATALDVARYFLSINDEDAGEPISHLKLQKLCYYAQGFYLAIYGKPLFPDKIEAWQHGPVVRNLWDEFKQYGSGRIPQPEDFDASVLDEETRDLLDEIFEVYGQFSALKLRNMTHLEPPWSEAFTRPNKRISLDSMKAYFKTQVA